MIRFKQLAALVLLSAMAVPALAEIKFEIGEPSADTTRSGIGQISGWAVSDSPVESVEAFIDGTSLGLVPYGGTRSDVAAAFPEFPDSEFSGWSMKWNYSLLAEGEHVVSIVVTDVDGAVEAKEVTFSTTSFKSPFIANPEDIDISSATVTASGNHCFVISDSKIEGEVVDIELCWDKGSQQFQINKITPRENSETNQNPRAYAGSNKEASTGQTVIVEGIATDEDGKVVSFAWQQVSGPDVVLYDAHQRIAQFTAPDEAGSTVNLRLTVTDDEGAEDSDDIAISIIESEPEPEPENLAPTAYAGPNLTVEMGSGVVVAGIGSDLDGTIALWAWEHISGLEVALQGADSKDVQFTAPQQAGTIQLRLTVTDDEGAIDSDDVTVTVQDPAPAPNQSPTANAGPNFTVEQGEDVLLTGSGTDPDGTIVSWSWRYVSGPDISINNADSQVANFTAPNSAGDVRIRLEVTDDRGGTDTDDMTIKINEAADPEPDPEPDPDPGSENTSGETLQSMLSAINAARGQAQTCGDSDYPAQPDLSWSSSLADVAMQHSMDMATIGYFAHTSDDGTSVGERVFPYWSGKWVGENIAASSGDRSNSYVVNLWMDSPGHCALIMSPNFTHAGVGAGHNAENGYTYHHFWTLDFGG
jgi:uncharacterized protein YkwD